jgi:hypothetical protein
VSGSSNFWAGFEKRAASMSGIPGMQSGASRLGTTTVPKPGITSVPKAAKLALPTPKPIAPTTTAAVLPKAPSPTKVHVPKPTVQAGAGVSSMAI